jgi:YidC/Oxa1 family membrane protein insertase
MDKTSWIVVILCSLGLMWWCGEQNKVNTAIAKARQAEEAKAAAEAEATAKEEGTVIDPQTGEVTPVEPAPDVTKVEKIEEVLSTPKIDWTFSNIGGGIGSAKLKEHNLKHHDETESTPEGDWAKVILNRYSEMPIGALSRGNGEFEGLAYEISKPVEGTVVMKTVTETGLQVTKTFTLTGEDDPGRGHVVKLGLTMKYVAEAGNYAGTGFYLYTGSAAPLFPGETAYNIGFDYMRKGKDKFRDVNYFKKASRAKFGENCERLLWAGALNQFFTINVCAESESTGELPIWASRFPVKLAGYEDEEDEIFAVHGAIGLPDFALNPGEEISWKYEIYAGPKHYRTLRELDRERDEIMGFDRMPIFGFIAEPFSKLLSSLMDWLHNLFGNYGWAIIAITFIIRIAIWPLHIKSQRTMKRMSLLQPKMAEMKEKHKDNPQKMNQEMMGMYRDYGINPLGGCFPILLQMPIFFGFFSMLRSASELRHESWLAWVRDLSMPDTVMHIAGFPLNILPLLMGITMVLQMKMTPSTGDKMQRRIFMLMPLIFLVFCYSFASALALYWTAQNIISMGQTWLLRNRKDPELVKKKRVARPMPGKGGRPGPGGEPPKKPKNRGPRTGGGRAKRK